MNTHPSPADILAAYGHLIVRRAVLREDDISQALFDLAAGDRIQWTLEDWQPILADLLNCNDKIEDWITFYV